MNERVVSPKFVSFWVWVSGHDKNEFLYFLESQVTCLEYTTFGKDDNDHYTNKKNKGKQRVQDDELTTIVTEANMIGDETDWWIDTGVTGHICGNKALFTTYQLVEEGMNLSSNIIRKSIMNLHFSSMQIVTLR